jgi:osmoprotectant transport system permease protein
VTAPTVLAATTEPWVRWDWVSRHGDDIFHALREHVVLTGIAVGLGLLIAFPLALLARRWRWLLAPVLSLTGILYTIPSLALLALLVPWTGLSRTTAEIALVSYTLLILIRNIVAGVDGVPASVKEAADAMGYRPARRFLAVDLRLATPAIVAGLRIATVTTIGLVTVTGLIGLGGYGSLIDDGLKRTFSTPIVVGAGLSVVMAIVLDLGLVLLERSLTPWARRRTVR